MLSFDEKGYLTGDFDTASPILFPDSVSCESEERTTSTLMMSKERQSRPDTANESIY